MSGIESVKIPKGQPVFKEGDAPNGIYFVTSGKVAVMKQKDGKNVTLTTMGQDAVFGEMALIDNNPRSATVMALDNTECMKATKESFEGVLKNSPPMVQNALKELVSMVRAKNNTTGELSPELKQRIGAFKQSSTTNAGLQAALKQVEPLIFYVYNALFSYI